MRRRPTTGLRRRAPKMLRRFNPDEWPGETVWRRSEAYTKALFEYLDKHPEAWDSIEPVGDVPWDPAVDPP